MAWEPNYVDVEPFMDYVSGHYDIEDPDTDEAMAAIAAASRSIDLHCRRQFGMVDAPEARQYVSRRADLSGGWVIDIDDVHAEAVGAVLVNGVAPDTVPVFWPLNDPIKTRMQVDACGIYTVTLQWGWPEVPQAIAFAATLQAARFFKRRDAPFGVAGSPESGSEMRLLERLDPDVKVALRKYQRRAVPK